MSSIPHSLLHGSDKGEIVQLKLLHAGEHSPFGPAIYLTEDPEVARCYLGNAGTIYTAEVKGNEQLTISMNAPWKELSVNARLAIQKLFKTVKIPVPGQAAHAREILDAVVPVMGKRSRNEFLAAEGIWMLHGYIHPMLSSGLCDRGTQYAVLSEAAIAGLRRWEPPSAEQQFGPNQNDA